METKTVSSTTLVSKSFNDKEVSLVQRLLWILNTLYNQILAIFTVVLLWILLDDAELNNLFCWHIFLSTLAYVPLMAAAIILFSEDNLVSLYIRRTKRYWIHGILLTISFLAVTIGIAVETYFKEDSHRGTHFESTHAILGLTSWILVFVACVCGLVAGSARKFSAFIKPVVSKLIHNILGIAAFAIGMGSLYMEIHTLERKTSVNVSMACKWMLWFITFWSLLAAFKSLWGQLKRLTSWILVFVACVFGLVAGDTRTFSAFIKPVVSKLIHKPVFALGVGSSLYMEIDVVKRQTSENVYIACNWMLWFIITFWSLLAAFKSLWRQLKSIFS